jgi:hypothetical protein
MHLFSAKNFHLSQVGGDFASLNGQRFSVLLFASILNILFAK